MMNIYYWINGCLMMQEETESVPAGIAHIEDFMGDEFAEFSEDPVFDNRWNLYKNGFSLRIDITNDPPIL